MEALRISSRRGDDLGGCMKRVLHVTTVTVKTEEKRKAGAMPRCNCGGFAGQTAYAAQSRCNRWLGSNDAWPKIRRRCVLSGLA